jgi:hypothetical protein
MSSAFVELLQKSNLNYIVTRKLFKIGSRNDEILIASFIDMKSKKLQVKKTPMFVFEKRNFVLVSCMFG